MASTLTQPILPQPTLPRILKIGERHSKGVIQDIVFKTDEANLSLAHAWRHKITESLNFFVPLNEERKEDLGLLVGEAVNNAFKHSSRKGYIGLRISCTPHLQQIIISNPSEGYEGTKPSSDCSLGECGRGRIIMETILTDYLQESFRELGFGIVHQYFFEKEKGTTCYVLTIYRSAVNR